MKEKFVISNLNLVVLPVIINGRGPYKMVLDIGARKTMIHSKYVDELGLKVEDTDYKGTTAHGSHLAGIQTSSLDALTIAGKTRENIEVFVTESMKIVGDEQVGVIGANFLDHFTVVANYRDLEFELLDTPVSSENMHDFNPDLTKGNYMANVMVRINNAADYTFIIDTGASGSLINQDIADELNLELQDSQMMIKSPTGMSMAKMAQVESFSTPFGEFENQSFLVMPLSHLADNGNKVGGILGVNYLRDKILTVDYPSRKFSLK